MAVAPLTDLMSHGLRHNITGCSQKTRGEAVKIRTALLLQCATSNAKCSKEAWRTGSR